MPRIALIPGDGIGPEIMEAAIPVLEALADKHNITLEMKLYEAGDETKKRRSTALPKETFDGVRSSDAALMVAVGETAKDVILPLRQKLNLYVNLRPAKSYPIPNAIKGFDVTIVRENTEGLYVKAGWSSEEAAVDLRIITRKSSERICRYGYKYAKENGKRKVYVVHKANVLLGCKLFREVCSSIAEDEGFEYREMYVDAAAMRLAMDRPFDLIITTNMPGDILADLAAAYIGGLGMYPSGNIGNEKALFEPVHGTAPDIAGKGIANPMATLLSAAMMFRWLNYEEVAADLERAIWKACELRYTTPDIGGGMKTSEVCASVRDLLMK